MLERNKNRPGVLVCIKRTEENDSLFVGLEKHFELIFVEHEEMCSAEVKKLKSLLILLGPSEKSRELVRKIKTDPNCSYIPMVFVAFEDYPLETMIDCFDAGGCDYIKAPCEPKLIAARLAVKIRMTSEYASLHHLATTDFLTNLHTRRYLFNTLKSLFLKFESLKLRSIGCLMIDIDNFKAVNDTRGHAAGDATLITVGETILDLVRESDIVSRIGGDELAVVCPNITLRGIEKLAEGIRQKIEKDVPIVTTSIGVSLTRFPVICRGAEVDWFVDDLLVRADRALYQAKKAGKNRFRVFGAEDTAASDDVEL